MSYYQQNMLSIKSRTLLANILAEVVLLSESIEVFRQSLAEIDFFDCIALFRYLDREEKGHLREKDFQRAVGTSHRKLLTYAFSWFDSMKVGQISRLQFSAFLLPKENLQLRQLVAKRVQIPKHEQPQQATILLQFQVFSKLLIQIMNRQMKIIELRRQLIKGQDYSIRGVLLALDVNGHQWICGEDLFKFLKNFGIDVSLRQAQTLVESVNCSSDGKITEQQLRWTVQGFENKNKNYLSKIKDSNKKQHPKLSSAQKQRLQTSVPIVKQFTTIEDPINSDLNMIYKKLQQKYRASEKEQEQLDYILKAEEIEIGRSIDKECERFMAQFRSKNNKQHKQRQSILANDAQMRRKQGQKKARLRVERRIEQKAIQEMKRSRQSQYLQELKLRTSYLKSYYDAQIKSTYRISPSRYNHYITSSPLKKDYTNLTHLSRLTQVQSHIKGSQRSNYFPQLKDSSAYLNEAERLRDMIKKEREVEKQIQNRFSSGKYSTDKYSSSHRGSPLKKIREFSDKEEKGEEIKMARKKAEQSPTNKAFLSTQTNQFYYSSNKKPII